MAKRTDRPGDSEDSDRVVDRLGEDVDRNLDSDFDTATVLEDDLDDDADDLVDEPPAVDDEVNATTEAVTKVAAPAGKTRRNGLGHKLYTGEAGFKFIEHRYRWYTVSAVLVLASIAIMVFRGLNFGIDFVGGNTFEVPGPAGQLTSAEQTVQKGLDEFTSAEEKKAAAGDGGDVTPAEIATSQVAGTGDRTSLLIKTTSVDQDTATKIGNDLAGQFRTTIEQRLTAAGTPVTDASVQAQVSSQSIAATWGSDISQKAIVALLVFLVAVSIFLRFRYVGRFVVGALVALVHDLVIAAGVYAAIGFEVTPATVIGLLTILGFSLYDTVVVFDKVDENVKGITRGSRTTYAEATNLAINQTLMRSINTTVISLLPVGGLLFVGAGLLGAGTLKDLALVLFVGIAIGAYSSIFLAAPITVDFANRRPEFIDLERRVANKRADVAKVVDAPEVTRRTPAKKPAGRTAVLEAEPPATTAVPTAAVKAAARPTSTKPRPGNRPGTQRSRKRR